MQVNEGFEKIGENVSIVKNNSYFMFTKMRNRENMFPKILENLNL